MCKEDFRLGQSIRSLVKKVAIDTGTPVTVAAAAPNRVSISFQCVGDLAAVGPVGTDTANLVGFIIPNGNLPVVLLKKDWGEMITGAWIASTQLNPASLNVASAFLDSSEYK